MFHVKLHPQGVLGFQRKYQEKKPKKENKSDKRENEGVRNQKNQWIWLWHALDRQAQDCFLASLGASALMSSFSSVLDKLAERVVQTHYLDTCQTISANNTSTCRTLCSNSVHKLLSDRTEWVLVSVCAY